MMGPTKLKTIRKQVRDSFHMTDAELANWLDQQVEERRRLSEAAQEELESLRLLRDALTREVKGASAKRKGKKRGTSNRRR